MATGASATTLASRLPRLNTPKVFVWDEVFYANDALSLLIRGVEPSNAVHPPLGKWLIAASIELAGFTPFGWRLLPLVAGALTVGVVVVLARLITGSNWLAAMAALLVATDGIAFTTGRL